MRKLGLVLMLLLDLTVASGALAQAPKWGWLGVRIRDLTEAEMEELVLRHGIDEGYGVVLAEVMKGTPADRAGLRGGDLVVAFGGVPIVGVQPLQRLVGSSAVGSQVELTVLRGEGREKVRVTIGSMPEEVVAERVAAEFGFAVRDFSRDPTPIPSPGLSSATRLGPPTVMVVAQGSPAARGGLKEGDRIIQVNGREVTDLRSLRGVLQTVSLDRPLLLTVRRDEVTRDLQIPAPSRVIP